jgi:L-threonylcarbamoyladenylate synthase
MALPLLVSDVRQLKIVAHIAPAAEALIQQFWPGALTLVLQKQNTVSEIVTGRSGKVAVRMPNHPIPLFLAQSLGAPIVGTSANLSGMPSCQTASDAQKQLGNEIDMIVDGGACPGGLESTIVDVTEEVLKVVREGAIESKSILEVYTAASGHS